MTDEITKERGERIHSSLQTALVFAARYAHKRETSAAYSIVNAIVYHWDNLSGWTQTQLKDEAEHYARSSLHDWDRLKELDVKPDPN